MESTLQKPAHSPTDLSMPRSKGIVIGFWIVTAPVTTSYSNSTPHPTGSSLPE